MKPDCIFFRQLGARIARAQFKFAQPIQASGRTAIGCGSCLQRDLNCCLVKSPARRTTTARRQPGSSNCLGESCEKSSPSTTGFVPSYVRLIPRGNNGGSTLAIEGNTTASTGLKVWTSNDERYDVLIEPDDATTFPPHYQPSVPGYELEEIDEISQGTRVEGQAFRLREGQPASPVEGALLILQNPASTSTLGRSNATGQFSVRAKPGPYSAVVIPPVVPPQRAHSAANLTLNSSPGCVSPVP